MSTLYRVLLIYPDRQSGADIFFCKLPWSWRFCHSIRKVTNIQRYVHVQQKSIQQTVKDCCSQEQMVAMTPYTIHVQDQVSPNPSSWGEDLMKFYFLPQELMVIDGCWACIVSFLQEWGLWKATHVLIGGPIFMHIQEALIGLHGLKKRHLKLEGESGGGDRRWTGAGGGWRSKCVIWICEILK